MVASDVNRHSSEVPGPQSVQEYLIFPKGWVWRAKVRIHKERERVPSCYGGLWLLLLRVPCSPSCPDACSWKGRESPSVSCSTLVSDTENRHLGSRGRDLTAAGRGSPLERQMSGPFPSIWLSASGPRNNKGFPKLDFWEFAEGKDPKSRTGSQAWCTPLSWSLGGCRRELVESGLAWATV